MRDRELMEPSELSYRRFEYYKETHPPVLSDYKHRTPVQLAQDVTVAHDNIKKLVAEKDLMRRQLLEAQANFARWKKVFMWAIGATWAAILGLLKVLLPYIVKGILAK